MRCHLFQGIIHLLTSKKTNDFRCFQNLFAMRMINMTSQEMAWLHQDTTMFQVQEWLKNPEDGKEGSSPLQVLISINIYVTHEKRGLCLMQYFWVTSSLRKIQEKCFKKFTNYFIK